MNNIEKFFAYLGCSDRTINERQLLRLICLLNKESITIKPKGTEFDLLNQILEIYIDGFETNSFKVLTEHYIASTLCEIS